MEVADCIETECSPALRDGEVEVLRLRQELEMLEVDSERQSQWHHLIIQQEQEQQQWYEWAKGKLADSEHSEEQIRLEEERLTELLERRRMETAKTRERAALLDHEVLAMEHKHRSTQHLLEHQSSIADDEASAEHARMLSKRNEVDVAIARLKMKRDTVQEYRYDETPWTPQVAGA